MRKSQKGPASTKNQDAITAPLQQAKTYPPVGYARVSTEDQNTEVQIAALKAAGCIKIFEEKISAVSAKRPQFNLLIKYLEPGDTVLFHALTRLGRDGDQVRDTLRYFKREGITWRSLTEPQLDPSNAVGRLMINNAIAYGQFERDLIVERTKRGMDNCKAKGMFLGAPRKVTPAIAKQMNVMRKQGKTAVVISKRFGVSASAVYLNTEGPRICLTENALAMVATAIVSTHRMASRANYAHASVR